MVYGAGKYKNVVNNSVSSRNFKRNYSKLLQECVCMCVCVCVCVCVRERERERENITFAQV